jgi:hypothetical protein
MAFDPAEHELLSEQTYAARDEAWARCGAVDPYVLSPLINPSFQGGPAWPNLRQSYKTIRGPVGVILASDGLSDPFDDSWRDPPRQNGFALEVYGVTDSDQKLAGSWVFQIVAGFARHVANHGHIHELLDEFGTLSTELWDIAIPESYRAKFVNGEGRVGLLVGLDAPPVPAKVEGPVSSIRFANLKLLCLPELEHVLEHGEPGRDELARRLLESEAPLVSSLDRVSAF